MENSAKSILVVDDEEVMRDFLFEVLEDFEVEKASDGDEAINRLRDKRYDLVITDMKMPRVPGEEVVKFVKEKYPTSGIIVISGYSSLMSATSAVGQGIDAYLAKPFTIKQLRAEVEKAMYDRPQSDSQAEGSVS